VSISPPTWQAHPPSTPTKRLQFHPASGCPPAPVAGRISASEATAPRAAPFIHAFFGWQRHGKTSRHTAHKHYRLKRHGAHPSVPSQATIFGAREEKATRAHCLWQVRWRMFMLQIRRVLPTIPSRCALGLTFVAFYGRVFQLARECGRQRVAAATEEIIS